MNRPEPARLLPQQPARCFKIVWLDLEDRTDGRDFGEAVWRLGGKFSDFDFVDDEYAGPCAQHTATQLDNGNILIFDNGSPNPDNAYFNDASMCPDPADPGGDPVGRQFTRVTEYALDAESGTASLVWEHASPAGGAPWFAFFAGGVNRLDNGNTLISWASARTAVVTEVEAVTDKVVWQLRGRPQPRAVLALLQLPRGQAPGRRRHRSHRPDRGPRRGVGA